MKKKLLAFLMGSALVFSLAACGGGDDEAADTGDTADNGTATETENETASGVDAEKIYEQKCSACHGADPTQAGTVASDVVISEVGKNLSADEIKDVITNGKGAMPAQNLSDEELDAVVTWIVDMSS